MADAPDLSQPHMSMDGFAGFLGSRRFHDMDLIAKHMADTMRWYGVAVLVRRRFNIEDLENGLCERCGCYNPRYDQPASSRCPDCYGTGFLGGYFPVEFAYITMAGNWGHDEQRRDKQGWREETDAVNVSMLADRLWRDGDVIARISSYSDDGMTVTSLDGFWELDGKVRRQEEWGLHEPLNLGHGRVYQRDQRLVTMTGSMKPLLLTDVRTEDSFCGLS